MVRDLIEMATQMRQLTKHDGCVLTEEVQHMVSQKNANLKFCLMDELKEMIGSIKKMLPIIVSRRQDDGEASSHESAKGSDRDATFDIPGSLRVINQAFGEFAVVEAPALVAF